MNELVDTVAEVARKRTGINHVEGPVGVQSRNFSKERVRSLGWEAKVSLKEGIALTYPWVEEQVNVTREGKNAV